MARILAIDYGGKRTGLAVTDPLQIIATGLETIESKELIPFLKKYFSNILQLFFKYSSKFLQLFFTYSSNNLRTFLKFLKKYFFRQQMICNKREQLHSEPIAESIK